MIEREVTYTRKLNGDIIAFCNPGMDWSPVSKEMAIVHINFGIYQYYVNLPYKGKVKIMVLSKSEDEYLGTDPEETDYNVLEDLPDCF
ncbi:MAG TPA: hypothetical protein VKA34_10420 [Balneolales bacterium]|nr:hypothetical protein [Balneolales bacterium]